VTDPGRQIALFVREIRQQIAVAEDAGAEHNDLCIVLPASYIAMAHGWPTIELKVGGVETTVAVVPKLFARDFADEATGETSWAPPPSTSGGGLWGFTSAPTSLDSQGLKSPIEQARQARLFFFEDGR
jgi:hypothetical protein